MTLLYVRPRDGTSTRTCIRHNLTELALDLQLAKLIPNFKTPSPNGGKGRCMSGTIRLSPKHGVNPSLAICFFCQKDSGDIILPGLMKGDVEAPKRAVWDNEPCQECKGYMSQGIILISVNESLTDDMKNPYRSGGWCVIKEEAFSRMFQGEVVKQALKKRLAFMPDSVWDQVGLPR